MFPKRCCKRCLQQLFNGFNGLPKSIAETVCNAPPVKLTLRDLLCSLLQGTSKGRWSRGRVAVAVWRPQSQHGLVGPCHAPCLPGKRGQRGGWREPPPPPFPAFDRPAVKNGAASPPEELQRHRCLRTGRPHRHFRESGRVKVVKPVKPVYPAAPPAMRYVHRHPPSVTHNRLQPCWRSFSLSSPAWND